MNNGFYFHLLQKGSISEKDLEPDVSPFHFYIDAFKELSSCRQFSMAIGPIPFTAIVEYFRIYIRESGAHDDLDDFVYIIRRMDDTYLELVNAKANKPKDKVKTNASKPSKKN